MNRTALFAPDIKRIALEALRRVTHGQWFVSWDVVFGDGRTLPLEGIYNLPKQALPKEIHQVRVFLTQESRRAMEAADRDNRLLANRNEALVELSDQFKDASIAYVSIKTWRRV